MNSGPNYQPTGYINSSLHFIMILDTTCCLPKDTTSFPPVPLLGAMKLVQASCLVWMPSLSQCRSITSSFAMTQRLSPGTLASSTRSLLPLTTLALVRSCTIVGGAFGGNHCNKSHGTFVEHNRSCQIYKVPKGRLLINIDLNYKVCFANCSWACFIDSSTAAWSTVCSTFLILFFREGRGRPSCQEQTCEES